MKQNKAYLQDVINTLNKLQIQNETPHGWELLAKAYHQKGLRAESLYALAKYSFMIENIDTAKKQIKQALELNPSEGLKLKLSDLENEIKQNQD